MQLVGDEVPDPAEKATMCCSGDNVLLLGGDTTPSHNTETVQSATANIDAHGWLLTTMGGGTQCKWKRVDFSGVGTMAPPRSCA